ARAAAGPPERTGAATGLSAADPGRQIAARAVLGPSHVEADSRRHHPPGSPAPAPLHELVTADVRRAAQLIHAGLRSFALAPAAGRAPGTLPGGPPPEDRHHHDGPAQS